MSLQSQFEQDFNGLQGAAAAYAKAEAQQKKAEEYYHNTIMKKLDGMHDAFQIIAYLITTVFNRQPGDAHGDSSVLGIYGDKLGLYGKGLQVNNYLTKVHDDLQKMTDSTDTSGTNVKNVAEDLDKLLNELKNDKALKSALDPTALSNLIGADTTLREKFYVQGDTSGYNPTGDDYYFYSGSDPAKEKKYLTSFGEMQKDMKKPGDDKSATEAYKSLQTQFNSALGMTQTINSALNEQINQLTSFIKTLIGFYQNALCQPWMKLINAAIQNTSKG